MIEAQFVLAAPGYLAVAGKADLDGALRLAGVHPPRRVLCTADLDPATATALVTQIQLLAQAGVATEFVVAVAPAAVEHAGALLSAAMSGASPDVDVDLVAAADASTLVGPGTVRLEPVGAAIAGPTLLFAPAAAGEEPVAAHTPEAAGKYDAELGFWRATLDAWERWYLGEALPGGLEPPAPEERTTDYDLRTNAAVTFSRIYQQTKYITDLALHPDAFRGMRVLDVGCGPAPSMLAFRGAELHGIDPLADGYASVGFPLEVWTKMGFTYHNAPAEAMPFAEGHFDAVVSVNAIDHVDDFAATAAEIQRVLRPDGVFRMHVHYHPPTVAEPVELNDAVFLQHYGWVPGLRKISVSDAKDSGLTRAQPGESYVLWGNR